MALPALCLCTIPTCLAQIGPRPVLTASPQKPSTAEEPKSSASKPVKAGLSAANSPDYRIGPEDTLQINVWKEESLSGTFPVRPDGKISLVLLGDVQAAGMKPMDLAADLTTRLKKFIQDPLVTVTVAEVKSQKIFVLGEVQHVGPIELSADMTPLQAIAAAGGVTPFANTKKIYILRGTGANQKKIKFDYKKAIKGEPGSYVALKTGDTIVVP
ncbi:MAG: polysaccharide biosynthesis/export family protein [Acidobacteria bacterium]|nr:polysaccharide biosynthesis/export family protein [Acidobacteriota bacterium]